MNMFPEESTGNGAKAPPRAIWGLTAALALGAAGVSGYLLATTLAAAGRPVGCGQGSGCDEVLASRWSRVLGAPVSLPAAMLDLAIFVAALRVAVRSSTGAEAGAGASRFLLFGAGSLLAAAVWFLGLQWLAIGAFCPWCLAAHGLGSLAAVCIVAALLRSGGWHWFPLMAGGAAVMLLAALQIAMPSPGPAAARLPAGEDYDSGPGADRVVAMLDGKLVVETASVPSLGSQQAPHVIALLFDYCCPHCRRTHADLKAALERYPDQLQILLLPTPLDAECNPGQVETEPRFEEACELARIALAVWRTAPGEFPEFDEWLFEPETPRTADEAMEEARRIAGTKFVEAVHSPRGDEQIARNVEAYMASEAGQIPVLLSPGMSGVVGRTSDREELFELLERELKLAPQPEAPR